MPYHGDIPNGLVPGKQIFIAGKIPHHANRFAINLVGSQGTIFHLNPRFDQNSVVCLKLILIPIQSGIINSC